MSLLAELPLRIVPPQVVQARRPQRLLERQWIVNRAGGWHILVTGFFEPLFYLMSIRIGFGALVGDVEDGGRLVPYAEFVAPALLAASAMNGALYESTMNVFFKMKYDKVYDAALATPLTSGDVALGEILYATLRGALYSAAFLLTMWALGMTSSMWALGMLPVAALISFAFSSVGMAATTYMRSWADFEYVPSIMLPMFLFSATFYPLSSYGDWAWLAQISPLYHGVAMCRSLNIGEWSWAFAGHLTVLVAMALIGVSLTARRIERLLLP
ncbi:MAG: ABC transporter permease [Ilumatobacter sp.]|uniref:ABC transporter permease n=1 Tax=Ilumatobacter sp. TaxID=1967498 RepID=UPI00262F9382|nr:ABC transporter permease [Ilumatobacter sp.]MDJ0770258.1 ABC transporter permease [Ilumatobacter sp.]